MPKSIPVKRKKRGRPATRVDPFVGVRIPARLIATIDQIADQHDESRSEAIRRLIELGLTAQKKSRPD